MAETIRLATRGSDLAIRQARTVAERLESRRVNVELVEVETTGDTVRDELIHRLGRTGAFVRSLDERVIEGTVDAAVHSMKDMPTEFPAELVVAGVPERAAAGDVLVTPGESTLESLPDGAVVGTSSLRRRAQLLAERPDLEVRPLRGNVDTRVAKLLAPHLRAERDRRRSEEDPTGEGDEESVETWLEELGDLQRRALETDVETNFDAIVLAEAGLVRLELLDALETSRLQPDVVPAPGQGAIAVSARDDDIAETIHRDLDHPRTRVETTVERTILGTLGGGCIAPIGIHAVIQGEHVHTSVRALAQDGEEEIAATRDLPVERHPEAAQEFAEELDEAGASELIERARRDA